MKVTVFCDVAHVVSQILICTLFNDAVNMFYSRLTNWKKLYKLKSSLIESLQRNSTERRIKKIIKKVGLVSVVIELRNEHLHIQV